MSQHGLELYVPRQHKAYAKKMLKEEWNYECAYCGIKERHKELTLDHIIPIKKGGDDSYSNLIPACRSCNLSKGHSGVRQWYFDHEEYSTERWLKIKNHMNRKTEDVFAA
jgi:5-methylcytosine-specific restriction endonuclease McrA